MLKLEIEGFLNLIMRYLEIPMAPTFFGSIVERGEGTGLHTSYIISILKILHNLVMLISRIQTCHQKSTINIHVQLLRDETLQLVTGPRGLYFTSFCFNLRKRPTCHSPSTFSCYAFEPREGIHLLRWTWTHYG